MKTKLTRIFRTITALVVMLCLVLSCIPAVQASNTSWAPLENSRILWVETADSQLSDESLSAQVRLFDSELAAKVTGQVLPILYGPASEACTGDILLVLDSSLKIPSEGYRITLSGGCITVSASDAHGLFYGSRSLIRQLLETGAVTAGEDAPDVAERAVSLDNGRKYFSADWIKEFIREMSWCNMNTLVLHFSEEMGLGIESKLYPWLAGRDGSLCTQAAVSTDNRYLTQAEVRDIVEYARLYHIEVVPSFDSPGHMNYVVKKFNEKCAKADFGFTYNGKTYVADAGSEIGNYFHYNGKTTLVKGSRNQNYSRGIDISNEVAVAFTKSLIEEYASLFRKLGCTRFDIGGDELLGWGAAVVSTSKASRWQQLDHWKEYAIEKTGNSKAVAYDSFLLYMNDLYNLVTGLGYTAVRMWNDDALRSSDTGWNQVVQLNKDIDIWYWTTGTNPVKTYTSAGYQVYNIVSTYNYYAMTPNYFSDNRTSFVKSYPDLIYNEWNPYVFDGNTTTLGSGNNLAASDPNVLGSAFGVWCDNPTLRTADEVMDDLLPLIRAHAAKAWDIGCHKTASYAAFVKNQEKTGNAPQNLPEAPQITTPKDESVILAVQPRSSWVFRDRKVQLDVYLSAKAASIAVQDQSGAIMPLVKCSIDPDGEGYRAAVQFVQSQSGRHTYTVCALDQGGTPLPGCVQFTITCY